jgi:hypothetical protein
MRIRTNGKFGYREELVDDVAGQLCESARVGAVEASAEFTQAMLLALAKAVEHEYRGAVVTRDSGDPWVKRLASILSRWRYAVETDGTSVR